MARNESVEAAVTMAIEAIDDALGGVSPARLPPSGLRNAIDQQIAMRASVRVASLFLLSYSICDNKWDLDHIPTGVRGKYGDKRLAAYLSERDLTLHDNITAFGENLGWKGNVQEFRLSTDKRFVDFMSAIRGCATEDRSVGVGYFAARFAESHRVQHPLPPLPKNLLTFARARVLFGDLIELQSEGHIQQFVVAGLLRAHRRRFGHIVRTHHPHASDKFDGAAGDVEEFREGALVAAYEVTVRDDWKNRLPDFRRKMQDYGLQKYWIIASKVYTDAALSSPAEMLEFLDSAKADLAIVDINAFVDVFLAELSEDELRDVVNEVHADLQDPSLSNRQDFIDAFRLVIGSWLDAVTDSTGPSGGS